MEKQQMLDKQKKIRSEFPLLSKKVNGRNLVYLDSAATALKPWSVIERISHFYSFETANVHRGAHYLADQATRHFEESRESVKGFLNAKLTEEIIFTKGTTESINLVAQTWGKQNLKKDDEVLLSEMEHHANIVPWQMIQSEIGFKIQVVKVTDAGELDLQDFYSKLSERTKLVSLTHCSNTLGTINPVDEIIKSAHKFDAKVLLDGAQILSLRKVDVQNLDVDFYVFSGHKIFGPFGVGVLYGKKAILDTLPPYQGGGSMISKVTFEKTTFNDAPFRFEAGTPAIDAIIGLKPAIDYIQKLDYQWLHEYENYIYDLAISKIKEIPGVKIYGTAKEKAPIISFNLDGAHHADVGQILDQENVAVRVGHHCNQPLMDRFKIPGTVRASFSVYNSEYDVEMFIKALIKAKDLLL